MPTQNEINQRKAELQKTVAPPYTVAGPTLTPLGKEFQRMTLARDWDALFNFLPAPHWGQYGMLGKYSFVDQNGKRIYKPFTKDEIRRFVFSPHYTVQPGWTCTDEQREMGVNALYKAGETHKAKFAPTDWRHIWPIYPGWGYPGQRYGCEKYQPSTWVKIRKPVVAAALITTAVFVGPAVLAKAKALTAGGSAATGSAASGAASAATGAAATTGTGSAILAGSQKLVGVLNKANTVKAIAEGKLPPPPISIAGDSWREWATIVAKEEIKTEAKERAQQLGMEYVERKLTEKEERALQAEIADLQRKLLAITPKDVVNMPPDPSADLSNAITNIQRKEVKREFDLQQLIIPGAIVAGALLLGG